METPTCSAREGWRHSPTALPGAGEGLRTSQLHVLVKGGAMAEVFGFGSGVAGG